jgi:hypothetical protein
LRQEIKQSFRRHDLGNINRQTLPHDQTTHDRACRKASRSEQPPSDINPKDNGADLDATDVSEVERMLEVAEDISDEVQKSLDEVEVSLLS